MTNNENGQQAWTDIDMELLDYLLAEDNLISDAESLAENRSISPRAAGTKSPASFAQQRLWLIAQINPTISAYHVPLVVQLQGPLYKPYLDRSLQAVIARHETLRTVFTFQEGELLTQVLPAEEYTIPLQDLSAMPATIGQSYTQKLLRDELKQPFDLEHGPILRTRLLRMAADEHLFMLIIHHIACDGWSLQILARELALCYDALSRDQPVPFPPLSIQYADYAVWQRKRFQGEILETEASYWRTRLAGSNQEFELPTDCPVPPDRSDRGAAVPFVLDQELLNQLRTITQQEKTTLFMTLLAVLEFLLGRYSRSDDFLIGTPVAGRTHTEIEGLIGFFANTLVLRADLSGNPSFRELLARVRATTLDAFAHQEFPFEKIVDELRPARTQGMSALLQILFTFDPLPTKVVSTSAMTFHLIDPEVETVAFDLILRMWETPDGISGQFEYSTDLFQLKTIEVLARHFQLLLRELLQEPDRPLSQFTLLTSAEREQIIGTWNETGAPIPQVAGIHELVERQVAHTPDSIAVVGEDGQHLSYALLNRQANWLARHLRQQGIGPGMMVGICLPRSTPLVIAVLAVLKTGGAYVALDPTYPATRLELMVHDAQVSLVITNPQVSFLLPETCKQLLFAPEEEQATDLADEENLNIPLSQEDACYIIYTSGSTGQPKGTTLPHRVLINLIHWHIQTLKQEVRLSQHSSFSFDSSVHEMFVAWTSGGTLVIVPDEARTDPVALANLFAREAVEKAILPAILLHHLAEIYNGKHAPLCSLKEVIAIGEQLVITPAVRQWFEQLGNCQLHNHYGPSETHVVTAATLSSNPADWPVYPSIGRPIANTRVYLLDHHGQPVPIGLPGELYLGGIQLAHGYIQKPDLTAQRFIPDPFSSLPGERLYATGDLARYLSGGEIEFLGRIDQQVKIRGYRVEPGEVETILYQHPRIREVVVFAEDDPAGGQRLIACLVPEQESEQDTLTNEMLRQFLRGRLPDYLIPSAFLVLEALPLTSNGKVDRHALLHSTRDRSLLTTIYQAPRSLTEHRLTTIWMELFQLERIGIHDNYFDLGGNSLSAMSLIAQIGKQFQLDLRLRDLFEAPTIAELAENIDLARIVLLGETQVTDETDASRTIIEF